MVGSWTPARHISSSNSSRRRNRNNVQMRAGVGFRARPKGRLSVQTRERVLAQLRPVFAAITLVLSAAASAQSLFPGDARFTAAQAERGQAAYALNCQSCHGSTLEGTQFG